MNRIKNSDNLEDDYQHMELSVRALSQEVDMAISFYSAWRPLSQNRNVAERFGRSFATRTLNDINRALQREMLMSLCRLWDNKRDGAISLTWIICRLRDKTFQNYFFERRYGDMFGSCPNDVSTREQVIQTVHPKIIQAVTLVQKYMDGGAGYPTLESAKRIRHERLAHLQIVAPESPISFHTEEQFDEFYGDMLTVSKLLLHIVCRTAYEPRELEKQLSRCADHFWDNAHSEHQVRAKKN